MDAEHPEHPGRRPAELPARPGEHGPQIGCYVPGVQPIKPRLRVTQLGRQCGERQSWSAGRARGGNAQGERQSCAQVDQVGHLCGRAGDPVAAEAPLQHLARLLRRENIQDDQVRAFGRS